MKITYSLVLLCIVSCISYSHAQNDSLHKRSPYISVNYGYEASLTNASGGSVFTLSTVPADNVGSKAYNFYAENCSYFSISGFAPIKDLTIGVPFSISYSQPWFDVKNFAATESNNQDMNTYTGTSAGRYKILSLMSGIDFSLLKRGPVTAELKLMAGTIIVNEPLVNYTFFNPDAVYYTHNNGVSGPDEPTNQALTETTSISLAFSAGLGIGYKINQRIGIALNCDLLCAYLILPTSDNGAGMIDFHSSVGILYTLKK